MRIWQRAGSELQGALLHSIQRGHFGYSYRGVPTQKNPFDWTLYPMLLWEVRPRTIIEIGSNRGGSALWLADTMRAFELPAEVHSVDVNQVTDISAPGVTFHHGDARRLEDCLSADFMAGLARPLLVIEDSDHQRDTVVAVLKFFDRWLLPGEYIIVEDGVVTQLGIADDYAGGPQAGLAIFLDQHAEDYEIDARYCDFYGRNVTYAVNGYLRRRRRDDDRYALQPGDAKESQPAASPSALRLGADDARLQAAAGARSDGAIRIAETDKGVLLWGPYLSLPAGDYSAALRFHRERPCRGSAMIEVCVEGGKRILGRASIDGPMLAASGVATVAFSAPEALAGVEVRLGSDGGFAGDIESLEIAPRPLAGDVEAEHAPVAAAPVARGDRPAAPRRRPSRLWRWLADPRGEAYFRMDRLDPLLDAFRAMQRASESCERRLAAVEQRLGGSTASSGAEGAAGDTRAEAERLRRERDAEAADAQTARAEVSALRTALARAELAAAQRVAAISAEAEALRQEVGQLRGADPVAAPPAAAQAAEAAVAGG